MEPPVRDRLIAAAFDLFEKQGFEATTVEQIASHAGAGRTTFFRNFAAKEDVLFPHHDTVLGEVDARLATATPTTRSAALREGARIVLDHYLAEGELARRRYRLTSTVPTVRERETAAVQRYQRLFARHLTAWLSDEPDGALRAELTASAVITAHNHVLRQWLRGDPVEAVALFDDAMDIALRSLAPATEHRTVIVTSGEDVESVLRDVRAALVGSQRDTGRRAAH
jgi:AcrR family transcriptional regulator